MKIQLLRCPNHPEFVMKEVLIANQQPFRRGFSRLGYACTAGGCSVRYEAGLDYFTVDEMGKVNIIQTESHPCSRGRREPRQMVLTEVNGQVKWACDAPKCTFTKEFSVLYAATPFEPVRQL